MTQNGKLCNGWALGKVGHNKVALVFLDGVEPQGGVALGGDDAQELADELERRAAAIRDNTGGSA